MAPGTMKHSRPCSSAHEAVISAPLRAGASTTTVASARPLTIRLRRGNVPLLGRDVRRELRDDGATGRDDRGGEPAVRPRVQDGVAPADDRDGRAAARARRGVGGAVDTHREPRHDAGRRPRRGGREPRGDAPAGSVARRVPTMATAALRAHRRRVAEDVQDVGWHRDRGQPERIGGSSIVTTRRPTSRIRATVAPACPAGVGDRRGPPRVSGRDRSARPLVRRRRRPPVARRRRATDASRRIANPVPYRPSRAANPTGPSPRLRPARPMRPALHRPGSIRAGVARLPKTGLNPSPPSCPTGPASPTPSIVRPPRRRETECRPAEYQAASARWSSRMTSEPSSRRSSGRHA